MKKYFERIYGNNALTERIGSGIESGQHSHAYLIEGPEGSGKFTFAKELAAALSCKKKTEALPCGICDSCHKILNDNAVDVHVITKGDKAAVGVDAIRILKTDVYLSSTESDYKVYIVREAHLMTAQAQNALLKVLEEPPDNVVIILLCDNTGSILTTVKSRVQTLRMEIFDTDKIDEFLTEASSKYRSLKASSPEKAGALLIASKGRIGEAYKQLDEKSIETISEKRAQTDAFIDEICTSSNYAGLYTAISAFPQKRQELSASFGLVISAIHDLIIIKKSKSALLDYYYDRQKASELAARVGLKKLFAVTDKIIQAQKAINSNANISVITAALIWEIKNIK